MELKDIIDLPEYQRLQEIERQREQLQARAKSPDLLPEVKEAYNLALLRLDESLRAEAQAPSLQESYAGYGLEGVTGLKQIQPLEEVLTEENLAPLRDGFRAKVVSAREFFEKYGAHTPQALEFVQLSGAELAVAKTIGVTPVSEPEETGPSEDSEVGEAQKTPLLITVRHGIVKIGKQGKSFKLFGSRESYHDYSEERLKALKILAASQELTVQEIKDALGAPSMDNNHFAWIRNWLISLSHGRTKLIEQPRRGVYQFSPRYLPEIIEITTSETEQPTPEWVSRGCDMFVVARHIAQFNPINPMVFGLEAPHELLESLQEYRPDYSAIRGNEKAIRETRVAAVDRIYENEDNIYKFMSVIPEDSPVYKFVDGLIGLEPNQRYLLRRFMRSKPEMTPIDEKTAWYEVIEEDTKDVVIQLQVELTPDGVSSPKQLIEGSNEKVGIDELGEAKQLHFKEMALANYNADAIISLLGIMESDRQRVIAKLAAIRRQNKA